MKHLKLCVVLSNALGDANQNKLAKIRRQYGNACLYQTAAFKNYVHVAFIYDTELTKSKCVGIFWSTFLLKNDFFLVG